MNGKTEISKQNTTAIKNNSIPLIKMYNKQLTKIKGTITEMQLVHYLMTIFQPIQLLTMYSVILR